MAKPKRIRSGNQFKKAAEVHLPHMKQHRGTRSPKRSSGSHNSKQYQKKRNEVRKAQRRISALQQQLTIAQSPAAQQRLQSQIDRYNSEIEATRTYSSETGKKIRTKAEVQQNIESLSRMNEQNANLVGGSAKARQLRANKATEKMINMASSRKTEEASPYTRTQVQIFYRATQEAWQNSSLENRNQAILNYYGMTSLQEVFEQVTGDQRNKDVQRANEIVNNPQDYSEEDRKWAFNVIQDNEDEYQISPEKGAGLPASDVSPVAPME